MMMKGHTYHEGQGFRDPDGLQLARALPPMHPAHARLDQAPLPPRQQALRTDRQTDGHTATEKRGPEKNPGWEGREGVS